MFEFGKIIFALNHDNDNSFVTRHHYNPQNIKVIYALMLSNWYAYMNA